MRHSNYPSEEFMTKNANQIVAVHLGMMESRAMSWLETSGISIRSDSGLRHDSSTFGGKLVPNRGESLQFASIIVATDNHKDTHNEVIMLESGSSCVFCCRRACD